MANAIPLLAGTDASGGFLVEDAWGPVLSTAINNEAAVMSLADITRIATNRERFPVFLGEPDVTFVAEGAEKPATGAEFTELAVDVKKLAATLIYSDELLEDARIDPTVLVNARLGTAFAKKIDQHALGRSAAGPVTSQFNSTLAATSQTVELGTTGDALAVAVSSAMSMVEGNGYQSDGIVLATDARGHLRAARGAGDNATSPVYTDGYSREPDGLYGLPIRYTVNLQSFGAAAAAGRVVGIVGAFGSNAKAVVRGDLSMSASNQATVNVGGTLHHLWQQNKTAVRFETRLGFVAFDLSRAFVAITNAV
jgi:HK97 family phage major capsid protein